MVAHLHGVQGVPGSNPGAPTKRNPADLAGFFVSCWGLMIAEVTPPVRVRRSPPPLGAKKRAKGRNFRTDRAGVAFRGLRKQIGRDAIAMQPSRRSAVSSSLSRVFCAMGRCRARCTARGGGAPQQLERLERPAQYSAILPSMAPLWSVQCSFCRWVLV